MRRLKFRFRIQKKVSQINTVHARKEKWPQDCLRSINLNLNKSKCKIWTTNDEITYIGHVLSEEGLKPDPEKIGAIQDMPQPEDKAVLQRFTGSLQYLSKFIPNLSDISTPLRKLEGNVEWHWGIEQQQCFDKLKFWSAKHQYSSTMMLTSQFHYLLMQALRA